MVRRGSTVRVRQRASSFLLLSRCFRCLRWRQPRALTSTQRPPASTVDVGRRSTRRAGGSRARVRRGRGGRSGVDHGQAGAHAAGEVEGGDAFTEREGGERMSEIVDPAKGLDPGRDLPWLPLSVAEVVQVEVAAPLSGEHECAVPTPTAAVRSPRAQSSAAVPLGAHAGCSVLVSARGVTRPVSYASVTS
jgi:hypothetical protein